MTRGLVGYWSMDEGFGDTAYDATTYQNNGTLGTTTDATTKPKWTTGKIGGALSFDGVDDYVNMGDPIDGSLDFGTNSFSLSAWFKTTSTGYKRIISKGHSGFSNGYLLQINTGEGTITSGIGGGGVASNAIFFKTSNQFNDDSWHHAAVIFDRTAGTAKIYINGVAQSLVKLGSTCGSVLGTELDISSCASATASTTDSLNIGRYHTSSEYWDGLIDDVRIYNYARSPLQIQIDYNEGLSTRL